MRYIKVENNTSTDYSIEQLFIDHSTATIYKNTQMPNEQLLANYNVYPLVTEAPPQLNEDETATESTAEFRDGEWHQTWTVRKLTESEIQHIIDNRTSVVDLDSIDTDIEKETAGFFASTELQEQRYETCKGCDAFTALKTCRECGCIMPLKIKIAGAACPLDKW